MRWAGQWPQHGSVEFSQDAIASDDDQLDASRPLPNQLMAIDHQLHQQLQQQFCVEQFQLLSQLQVSIYCLVSPTYSIHIIVFIISVRFRSQLSNVIMSVVSRHSIY